MPAADFLNSADHAGGAGRRVAVDGADWRAGLQSSSYFTGWLLLATIVFLALFQLRKKLPAPPLGSSAAWLQVHIYTGLATAGLFALHTPLRWPNGVLESLLAVLYVGDIRQRRDRLVLDAHRCRGG